MRRSEGIAIAHAYRDILIREGIPALGVVLFGSVARDEATADSDLDLAVLCEPFASTRHEENMALRRLRWGLDIRIEPICLHPGDFAGIGHPLASEVQRTGMEVRAPPEIDAIRDGASRRKPLTLILFGVDSPGISSPVLVWKQSHPKIMPDQEPMPASLRTFNM